MSHLANHLLTSCTRLEERILLLLVFCGAQPASHAICGIRLVDIFFTFIIYLYIICNAFISNGLLPVSSSITEYGVVVLTPRCLHKNFFWILSISFHVLADMLAPQTSTPYSMVYTTHVSNTIALISHLRILLCLHIFSNW